MVRWVFGLAVVCFWVPAVAGTVTVSAAISLKESLTDVAVSYEKQTGDHVRFNFNASGKLAAQVREGAPVDLFISADDEQVDKLVAAKLADPATRRVVVKNALVLVVPADSKAGIKSFADLSAVDGKVAVGDPKTVPAGRYAGQTFKALKLDAAVGPKLVYGQNVRQVLAYVERGEVAAGVVYKTDAEAAGDKVRIVATADAATHEEIEYPAVVVTGTADPAAAGRFLDYLGTEPARAVFSKAGFELPEPKKN